MPAGVANWVAARLTKAATLKPHGGSGDRRTGIGIASNRPYPRNSPSVRRVAPSWDWTNDWACRPSAAAYSGSSRQRRTNRVNCSPSSTTTAASWASIAATMSRKFQVLGRTRRRRRRRPARSCSVRRGCPCSRRQTRSGRFPTTPPVRRRRRPGGREGRGEREEGRGKIGMRCRASLRCGMLRFALFDVCRSTVPVSRSRCPAPFAAARERRRNPTASPPPRTDRDGAARAPAAASAIAALSVRNVSKTIASSGSCVLPAKSTISSSRSRPARPAAASSGLLRSVWPRRISSSR